MKKVISITLSLLLALSVLTSLYAMPINASEGDYEENGICYKLNGDNTAAAVSCEDDLSYIAIPEELDNGYKVTEISDGAFRGKVDFTSAYIDAKLSKIGDYAFESCSHIETVSFSQDIGSIGKGAFSMCAKLNDISFSGSVKSLGDGAFFLDESLKFMSLPKSVESVGEYCFAYTGLNSLVLNKNLKVIPERFCYGCKMLKSVVLPQKVEEIESYAFRNCYNLDVTEFPETLDKIGVRAFESTRVSEAELNCSEIGDSAFRSCSKLESVSFTNNLKKVGTNAFDGAEVDSFPVYDGVEYADGALSGIRTDNFVLSEDSASYTLIDGILYSKDKKTLVACPAKISPESESAEEEGFIELDVENTVEKITAYAFNGVTGVNNIRLPNSVTEIGEHAFEKCGLSKIDIPDGVKEIKPFTYASCDRVASIDFGKVEKLDTYSFYNCSDYEVLNVRFSDTIKSIDSKAFINSCIELSDSSGGDITVKNNLILSADEKTLLSCPKSNQSTVTIPEGVEKIADKAFITNDSVSKIYIPDSLKSIGAEGIGFCANFDYGYEEQRMVEGVCVIGNASDEVKQYCNDYNIGVFSATPKQSITSVTLAGGKTAKFEISNAKQSDITFSSNNDRIASISDSGTIKGISKGTTYVTAAAGMTYFKCKVTVTSESGIKYTGFDDSNYLNITNDNYKGWKKHYIDSNPLISLSFSASDEAAIAAYQGNEFYRAMNGAADLSGPSHASGEAQFGEGYEDMLNMIGHATNLELSRYNSPDSIVLYSGAKPYVSKLIAGEKDSLKNLKSKVGTTFDHPQFISTTLNQATSHNFYSKQDGVVMIIYAEKNALKNLPSGYIAAFHPEGEYEYLFQKDSKFELIDVGVRWYDGQCIGDYGSYKGYERYIKVRLLGGKDKPDTLPKPGIKLTKSSASLYVKKTADIKAAVKNSYDSKLKYKSSNTKVAKVSSKGKITALKKGAATITVSNSEASAVFKVTVKNPNLNKTSKTIKKGKSFTLKITGKVGTPTFKSGNKKVATVTKSGKITAKKKGKAIITVKTNGITLKCKITVK